MQQVFLLSCLQAARNKSAPFLFPSSYHIKCIGHTIKVRRAACERFSGLLFAFVKYFRHFSIPPPCRAQKPTMKKNCCVIFQHSAALQGQKNLYEEEPLCYTSAFRRPARPQNSPLLYGRRFLWRIPASARRAGADIWMPSGSYYSKADAAGMLSRTHCALIDGPDR